MPAICSIIVHAAREYRPVHTRANRGAVRQRRTGGGGGAQQPVVRGTGADRVRVEVCIVVSRDVVAAPRVVSVGLHEWERRRPHDLARGGGGGAARRLGLDSHGARRALVAARGTGHVRTCAPTAPHAKPLGRAAAAAHASTRAVRREYRRYRREYPVGARGVL